jgi:ribosomal protein S27AE
MCQKHLDEMLAYSNERRKARKKAKVCIECGDAPQWFGLRCVLCRARYVKGALSLGAIKALKKYRRNEAIADRRREAIKARELLTNRAKEVISLRHGLVDGFDWSLEEIGQKFSCTRERIRQIEERAYDDVSTSGVNLALLRLPYARQRRPVTVKVSKYEAKKRRAHQLVSIALKAGTLIRKPCEQCGDPESIAHHHKGYDFPLEVEWLCRHHHTIAHGRNKTEHYIGGQQTKPRQPAAWIVKLGTPDNPRIVALLERMKAFRPRLKQQQVLKDIGLKYQHVVNTLRGHEHNETIIAALEHYMTTAENRQRQIAA